MRTALWIVAAGAVACIAACATKGERTASSRVVTPDPAAVTPIAAGSQAAPDASSSDEEPSSDYVACSGVPKIDRNASLGSSRARSRAGGLMDPTMGEPGFAFYLASHAPTIAPSASGTLRLSLTGPARVKAGAPLSMVATLENTGSAPLVIGGAVDGSFEHWRSPYVDLYLREESTGDVYRYGYRGARCGNTNARVPADFVTLAPAAKQKPAFGSWASHVQQATIETPGRYAVWLVYTSCDVKDHGDTLDPPPKLPTPWFGTVASAPVRIEVEP